jgi:hypothetical protein
MQADVFLAPQIYAAIERTKIDMVPPFLLLYKCKSLFRFFYQRTANETCFFAAVKLPHAC